MKFNWLISFEADRYVFCTGCHKMTNLWGKLQLWMIRPGKADVVRLRVIGQGARERFCFTDEAVTKFH